MQHAVKCKWDEEMSFDIDIDGHILKIDTDEESGGKNRGPKPKPLILSALAGCTGMDVISILKKMREHIDDLVIKVTGELTEDHPRVYHKIHIRYEIKGKDLNMKNIEKAVQLSQEKYCGVSAMLKNIAELTYEIIIV